MYMKGVTVSLSLLLDQILKINNYLRKISLLFRVAPPLKKISNMLTILALVSGAKNNALF